MPLYPAATTTSSTATVGEATRILTADYTMPANTSLVVVDFIDDGGFVLEVPATGVVEVIL